MMMSQQNINKSPRQDITDRVDDVDEKILRLITERLKVIKEIGNYKKENNITILQAERWFEILRTRKIIGKELNLNSDFIDDLLKLIHKESVSIQTKIMNK